MTESERLRKEMEERGLLGTTGKKVIVSAAQKKINEKKGGTAKSRSGSASTGTARSRRDEIVRDTGLVSSIRDYRKQQAKKVKTPVKGTIGRKYDPEKGFTVQGLTVRPERSNAKNEKTRLYQTYDNLLDEKEIRKKYNYVLKDKNTDEKTKDYAAKALLSLPGADYAEVQRLSKLKMQREAKRSSAGFTAGLVNSVSGNVARIAAKGVKNEQARKNWMDTLNYLQETQAAHPTAGTLGVATGEIAKYASLGKVAEKAVLKGASALGGRMLASTAPDIAQQAAAKILLNPKNAKAARVAAGLLGQQAADTMVNTPMTIAAGIGEGKNKKEILKDIGKQEAMDAAFNVGLGALGAGAKKVGQAFKKASKKGPIAGIDFEKMGYKMADVDDGILEHMEYLKNNPTDKKIDYALSPVNERMAKDVSNLVGFDISGYGNNLKPNAFDHVNKRHGADGIHDKSMANPKDIAKVQYILDNYDDVALDKKRAAGFTDSNGKLSQKVVFKKRINGTYYVVEAVPNTKKKRMEVIGTFMQKPKIKKENVLPGDVTSPSVTSKSATAQFSTDIIPKAAEGVKNTGLSKKRLLSADEIPEKIRQEYENWNNPDYMGEKLREISEKYSGDSQQFDAEVKKITGRMQELEDMLGIRTQRVKDTEKKIQTGAVKEMKKILSLSGKGETEETKKLLQTAVLEGRTGKISEQTRERIFTELFDRGHISNRTDIDKDLKNHLKGLTLKISRQDASNIPDFKQWRKGTFGKIRSVGVGEKGNIDSVWMELHEKWPQVFSDEITNPAEQLLKIKEVADEMTYREIPLAETIDSGARDGLKAEFDSAMDRLQTELQKLTAYTNDRAAVQKRKLMQEGIPLQVDYNKMSTKEMKEMYNQRYQYKKAADKVRSRKNLTEGDKALLDKLHRGELDAETARKYAGLNGDDLIEVYNAEKPLYATDQMIREYKKQANSRFDGDFSDIMGDIPIQSEGKKGWRDLSPLRLMRETQERILDMVAPTKEQAGRLKQTLFDPIHANERDRTLFKNEFIDRLKQTDISTKNNISIKLPNGENVKTSESALVQWLGENRYQLRQMERKKGRATMEEIANEQELRRQIEHIEKSLSKEQLQRIDNGIAEFTEIYKEIHPKINEALIRNGYEPVGYIEGYFPHMNFDDPNNVVEAMAKKLGFDFSSKELPMDIAGRTETFRPGKKWAGNLLTRTGKETDYDALRAFDQYIDNISDVIYHTDDIKRLRSYEDYMRYTLSDEGIKARVDAVKNNMDLTAAEKEKRIDEIYEGVQNHSLQNYVSNIRAYTDLLAGKKHKVDRILETEVFGRKVYKAVNAIENRVAGNMVAGNIGSALTNFIPITQGMSNMSIGSNLRGLKESLVNMTKGEMDELTKKSTFLATREGSEQLYKSTMQKISEAGGNWNPLQWMEAADKFTTQAVWRSRYYDNLKKGMEETAAIRNADDFARGLFAGRSKGAMPTMFSSKTLKPLTMFQLEVNNQISYLMKDIPKEAQGSVAKMMKAYGGLVIGAYIYNDVYEKLTGRRSALDPFSTANQAIGDLTGTQVRNTLDILGDAANGNGVQLTERVEQKKPSEALENVLGDIGGNMPFVGGLLFDGGRIPVQSALPSVTTIAGAFGDAASGDDTKEKAQQTIKQELEKPLWYLGMPIAGGQVRKTVKGLDLMQKGGSYTQTNKGEKLQFAVDKDKKTNWLQAALFGKWAVPEAQAHMEKNRTLSEKSTETYEKLRQAGAKNTTAFESINKMNREDKGRDKRRAIRSAPLSAEQKAILYRSILSDKQKDKEILDYFSWTNSMGEVADYLMRAADYKDNAAKKAALQDAKISDDEKEYIYMEKFVQDKSKEKEQSRIRALREAGIGMNDYLKIRTEYGQLYNEKGMKGKEKQYALVDLMNELGLTAAQQAKVKELFLFGGGYTTKWKI